MEINERENLITETIPHQNDLLKVVIYESSVEEDIEEFDFSDRPCLSFPLRAGFGYKTTNFDRFIDSNSFLVESKENEFSYTKYSDLGSDLTICLQFEDHHEFVQTFAKFRAAEVFRRTPSLGHLVHQLIREMDGDRLRVDSLIDQILFEEIFDESLEQFSPTPDRLHSIERIDQAKTYIHDHFASEIGIDEIADASCMSRFHFGRAFKKRTGLSPYRYLRQIRFFNAKEILKKDIDVKDVAFTCGFNSLEHFSAAFEAEFGVSPQTYRKSLAKNYGLR